jgi:hypothetical protein
MPCGVFLILDNSVHRHEDSNHFARRTPKLQAGHWPNTAGPVLLEPEGMHRVLQRAEEERCARDGRVAIRER